MFGCDVQPSLTSGIRISKNEAATKKPLSAVEKIFHTWTFPETHLPIITTFISGYQSILHSLLKNKAWADNIYSRFFRFIPFAYSSAICHGKMHSATTKNCNWKTIYCFFLQHLHRIYFRSFFGGYAWKNGNRMNENFGPKFRVLLNGKINFPPTPSIPVSMLCEFSLSTLLIRDVDLIRWKNIETFPRNIFSLRKVIFHRRKCFMRPPKMNIWQIETGFSDN